MARFMLNPKKANNYAFFCPKSRLHLTVSSPVGNASEVTSAIIRGVKSQAIIDLDGVIGNTAGSTQKTEGKAASAATTVAHTDEQPASEAPPKTERKSKGNSRKKAAPEEKTEQAAQEAAE